MGPTKPADAHNAGLGFGGPSPTKPAGAHDAGLVFRGARAPQNQLMLMMLGTVLDARTPQNQLAPQSQLMLMMLEGAGPEIQWARSSKNS